MDSKNFDPISKKIGKIRFMGIILSLINRCLLIVFFSTILQ
jgi:hypothetical protein